MQPTSPAPVPATPGRISVTALDAALVGARLIDVREPDEFVGELGHHPRAELVPLATLPSAALGWDRHERYVVICRSGGRSLRAAQALTAMGFTNVVDVEGGMLALRERQL